MIIFISIIINMNNINSKYIIIKNCYLFDINKINNDMI